jgi:tetraacyldisaccharide 4'-kinase
MKTPTWFLKKNFTAYALLPLAVLYFLGSKIVFIIKSRRQIKANVPVISIGGIMAGGVGKTPIVREIARKITGSVVLSHGYKGKKSGLVLPSDSATDVGDEAKMLSQDLTVYVGDRSENIKKISTADNQQPTTFIMDDGFQNPTIKKDISILVFDGRLGIGNGFILPAGPLRETLHDGVARADAAIIINGNENLKSEILNLKSIPVFTAKTYALNPGIRGRVIGFAGIGYPKKFLNSLRGLDMKVSEFVHFPDHHAYCKKDFKHLFRLARKYNARLVTTEKDWVKIPSYLQRKIAYVPLEVKMEESFWEWFNQKV